MRCIFVEAEIDGVGYCTLTGGPGRPPAQCSGGVVDRERCPFWPHGNPLCTTECGTPTKQTITITSPEAGGG